MQYIYYIYKNIYISYIYIYIIYAYTVIYKAYRFLFIFCIKQCLFYDVFFYSYIKHNVYLIHSQRPDANYFFQYNRMKKRIPQIH